MQDVIRELLAKRRDRVIAIILGMKERECDRYLPPAVQSKFRKVVLDQVNEFYELVVDLIRSVDTGDVVLNDLWMQKVDEIHAAVMGNDHAVSTNQS